MNIKPLLAGLGLCISLLASAAEVRLPQPGPDDLVFQVPAEWEWQLNTDNPRAANLRMYEKGMRTFVGQLQVMQLLPGNPAPDDAMIRKLLETTAQQMQPRAAEPKLDIEPAGIPGRGGYRFSMTEREPKPGQFKFITVGNLIYGRTVVGYTILANQDAERYVAAVQTMLADAKLTPGAPELMLAARKGGPTLALQRSDWQLNQQKHNPDGSGAYYFYSSNAQSLNFSVWLEPNTRCSSAETCLELAVRNPVYKDRQEQRRFDDGSFKATSFYIDASDKLPIAQLNILASAYVNGYWVDVHISQVGKSRPDPAAALALLHSLQLR